MCGSSGKWFLNHLFLLIVAFLFQSNLVHPTPSAADTGNCSQSRTCTYNVSTGSYLDNLDIYKVFNDNATSVSTKNFKPCAEALYSCPTLYNNAFFQMYRVQRCAPNDTSFYECLQSKTINQSGFRLQDSNNETYEILIDKTNTNKTLVEKRSTGEFMLSFVLTKNYSTAHFVTFTKEKGFIDNDVSFHRQTLHIQDIWTSTTAPIHITFNLHNVQVNDSGIYKITLYLYGMLFVQFNYELVVYDKSAPPELYAMMVNPDQHKYYHPLDINFISRDKAYNITCSHECKEAKIGLFWKPCRISERCGEYRSVFKDSAYANRYIIHMTTKAQHSVTYLCNGTVDRWPLKKYLELAVCDIPQSINNKAVQIHSPEAFKLVCKYHPWLYDFVEMTNVDKSAHVETVLHNDSDCASATHEISFDSRGSLTYDCVLRNKSSTALIVNRVVVTINQLSNVTTVNLEKGSQHPLECYNEEGEPGYIKWFRNGELIDRETAPKLQPFFPSQKGKYDCVSVYHNDKRGITYNMKSWEVTVQSDVLLYALAACAFPVGIVLTLTAVFFGRKLRNKMKLRQLYAMLNQAQPTLVDLSKPIHSQIENLPYDPLLEIQPNHLIYFKHRLLGNGEFGLVCQGVLYNQDVNDNGINVAVKVPKDKNNTKHYKALVAELKIMTHIGKHVNVLALLGVMTKRIEFRQLFLVLELCRLGSLKKYLQEFELVDEDVRLASVILAQKQIKIENTETTVQLSEATLLAYTYQIANGMEYLTSKQLIHRDLALRNILLCDNDIIKISDFGLALQEDLSSKKRVAEMLPLRWMALESILYLKFSVASDVWSFGVLCWELFSLGEDPPEVNMTEFVRWLCNGNRLGQPEFASDEIWMNIFKCWHVNPSERPNFVQLRENVKSEMTRKYHHQFQLLSATMNSYANYVYNKSGTVKIEQTVANPIYFESSAQQNNYSPYQEFMTVSKESLDILDIESVL